MNPLLSYAMSTYSLFQAHFRESFTEDTMLGPNTTRKVIPDCATPVSVKPEEEDTMTAEEKIQEVLSDPKFGMFSLFAYQVERGYKNNALKKQNAVFCSHICSLMLALPILVFLTQFLNSESQKNFVEFGFIDRLQMSYVKGIFITLF